MIVGGRRVLGQRLAPGRRPLGPDPANALRGIPRKCHGPGQLFGRLDPRNDDPVGMNDVGTYHSLGSIADGNVIGEF